MATTPQQPKKIRKWHWAVGIIALLIVIGLIVPDKKKSDTPPATLLDSSTSVTTTTPTWRTTITYPSTTTTTAMPTTTTEFVAPPPTRTSTYEPTYDPTTRDYVPPARLYGPTTTVQAPAVREDNSGSAYYPNCRAARAAGVAPLHSGDPGYSSKLDRDGDGVACE